MPAPITTVTDWRDPRIDDIIDVRSPAEFADDHIPGAINLPVFSNEQRAEIGTMYKQDSAFAARRAGAALVSANIAKHIHTTLADRPEGWRPLIHCWRGGQRSRAFAHICGEIGWAAFLLQGGYKTYRGMIMDELRTLPAQYRLILIAGSTGVGKTHLLHQLKAKQAQIIDLEGLAHHRGSLLGAMVDKPQPSQRLFESRLHEALQKCDPSRPIFVESESSRIGQIALPKEWWHRMTTSPIIEIEATAEQRVPSLKRDYAHLLTADAPALHNLVSGMHHRHGYDTTQKWQDALSAGDFDSFITHILTDHYDPAYQRSVLRHNRRSWGKIPLSSVDETGFKKGADDILELAQHHSALAP